MSEPIDGVLEEDDAPTGDPKDYDWMEFFRRPGVYYDGARWAVGKAIAVGIQHGIIHIDFVDGNFQVKLPKSWIEKQLGTRLPL